MTLYGIIYADSWAGGEIFRRGLASGFHMSFMITEPALKSLEVAKHGLKLGQDWGVKRQIAVVNRANCCILKGAVVHSSFPVHF